MREAPIFDQATEKQVRQLITTYTLLEQKIVTYISRVLQKQTNTNVERWVFLQQQRTAEITRELFRLVNSGNVLELNSVVRELVTSAYRRGNLAAINTVLYPQTGVFIPTGMAGLEVETQTLLNTVRTGLQTQGTFVHRQKVAQVVDLVASNTIGTREAVRLSVNQLNSEGVRPFVDRAGRRWSTSNYVDMAVRTTVSRAHLRGKVDGFQQEGTNLVMVPKGRTTRTSGTCDQCSPWEGKILSLTGEIVEPAVATLEQAKQAGLFHPRCRHTVRRFA